MMDPIGTPIIVVLSGYAPDFVLALFGWPLWVGLAAVALVAGLVFNTRPRP